MQKKRKFYSHKCPDCGKKFTLLTKEPADMRCNRCYWDGPPDQSDMGTDDPLVGTRWGDGFSNF
jgi:hypothetical protein